jgi:hypothetical protein
MTFASQDVVDLIKALAWPVTAIIALIVLHAPLSAVLKEVARRATKISIFKVEFDLPRMTEAKTTLEATVESMRNAVVVYESAMAPIAASVIRSGTGDYVVVALGKDEEQQWLTSRLFLLAAILERSRAVRGIVFTGEAESYIGAIAPRDLRGALGARFPEYEKGLSEAYGMSAGRDIQEFRGAELRESIIDDIVRGFLLSLSVSTIPTPSTAGWVYLDRSQDPRPAPSTWEFADWVTAAGLRTSLDSRLMRGTVVATAGLVASEKVGRSIVGENGAFVALLSPSGVFNGLCDRTAFVEKLARSAAAQAVPD